MFSLNGLTAWQTAFHQTTNGPSRFGFGSQLKDITSKKDESVCESWNRDQEISNSLF